MIETTHVVGGPKSAEAHLREWRAQQKELDARFGRNWDRPVIPVHVEQDPNNAIFDGQDWRPTLNITYGEYDLGRIKEGRVCLRCQDPKEEAFPEACDFPRVPGLQACGYPMRERQATDFEAEFEGPKHIGPTTSLSDEYERMIHNGKAKRHKPGSSVLLPGRDF